MSRNPTNDFIQFITGGSLFGGGIFLLANQVMASSAFTYRGGGWGRYGGGGSMVPLRHPRHGPADDPPEHWRLPSFHWRL